MPLVLAQHIYGFEGTAAALVFTIGFIGVVLLAMAIVRLPILGYFLVAILMANSLSAPVNLDRNEYITTWLSPVQMARREMHLGFSALLLFFILVTGRLNLARMPWQSWVMFAMAIYAGVLQTVHNDAMEAAQSLVFAVVTIPSAALASRYLVQQPGGAMIMVRSVLVVAALWAGACSVQFVLDPSKLVNNQGRFWGMLSNPQLTAMLVAPVLMCSAWGLVNDTNRFVRMFCIAMIGMYLLFLGWTGSRTGLLTSFIGVAFVLYSRLGKLVLLLPVLALLTFALSFLADELQIARNLERIVSTENTREHGWSLLLAGIQENPFIGVGIGESGATENSYLSAFASYGILMFLAVIVLTIMTGLQCLKIFVRKREFPRNERPVVDLFLGFCAMYFIGGIFEGYMLGRSSVQQTLMLMFAAVGASLVERLRSLEDASIGYVDEQGEYVEYGSYGEQAPEPVGRTPAHA